jgi:acyl-ACP thioesterase
MMTESAKSGWSETFKVSWMDADMHRRLKLSALFNYLQEIAWEHAENMGFGFEAAQKNNLIWVLVRLLIKMDRQPKWQQEIIVETWPRGIDGFWALREYSVKDQDGNVLGGASSSWMVLDSTTRRPVTPEIVFHVLPAVIQTSATGEAPFKIREPDDMKLLHRHEVVYSEIDAYNHVNNACYIDWITDAIHKLDSKLIPRKFHINYISEARLNDQVLLKYAGYEDKIIIKGENKKDGKPVFIAEIFRE